eukprot:TRINITY_DN7025_c0_g1_i2.p1 TRINITY_DN7025_c0_g1~~TRINITY_DN7025_c0_g1_i2.p1  ORF type:complete len:631 (+),score=152.48 TRINITY_DN7025_c0_g1_i2:29-1921(+)
MEREGSKFEPENPNKMFQMRKGKVQKKKRKIKIIKKQIQDEFINCESDSDCFGDSELSDSEDDSENVKHFSALKVPRKLFAKTRQTLAEEQLENNSKGELVCLTCLKRFSNIQNLRRHLRLHLKRDSNIPDFESDSENCDNNSKRFNCDFCPEKFDNKSGFLVHEKTHNSQELMCYICSKTYSDRYSLRYHLRTHGIGQQIRCELCGKNFTKQSRLQSHIDLFHNNIRKFKCSQCDKNFKTKIHLENHRLQHSGDRPHKCEKCGDAFRHKLSLVTHMRVHEDSRPYICDTCGKAFRDSSTLKAHSRVHSGDKPYKCNLCDKSFTQRAGLNYHKSVHAGSKPHKCKDCDYATAKKASLTSHIQTMHKNINQDSQVPATVPVPSTARTIEIECLEKTGACPPSLLSPPTQHGDAVFTTSMDIPSPLPKSLPSFNILKSYDSPSLHNPIVPDPVCASPCSESGGSSEDRHSPYGGHSDPSLSPPLTPPIQEYQDHSQNFQSFSSQSSFNRQHSYSFPSVRQGNHSTTHVWSKDYPPQEQDHHEHHLHLPYSHPEHDPHHSYCHQEHGHGRKSFFEYQNYYGLQSYGSLHYYQQKEEGYTREQKEEEVEGKGKKMTEHFYDKAGMSQHHIYQHC